MQSLTLSFLILIAMAFVSAFRPEAALASPMSYLHLSSSLKTMHANMEGKPESLLLKRDFIVYGVDITTGIKLRSFIIGVGADYNLWRQVKDPKQLEGSNSQGTELSLAAALGYEIGRTTLLGRYYLSSDYTLQVKDRDGNKVAYSSPSASYALQLRYAVRKNTYLGLQYSTLNYKEVKVGNGKQKLSDDSIRASAIGVLLGVSL